MTVAGWIAIALLWLIVVCLAVVILALARQIGVLHERLPQVGALKLAQALTAGQPAPIVDVVDMSGTRRQIGGVNAGGHDTLVVFLSPTCPVCKSLLPSLRSIRRRERPSVDVVLASDGSRLEHADFIETEGLQEFVYVLSEPLGLAYSAGRLPYAVLMDGGGVARASGLVNSREHLDSLFEAKERGVASLQDLMSASSREVA
jgi:methylamine dehydrogenase accessory protein MauD